nr:copia protein [Tanacetum cinerariifolium]
MQEELLQFKIQNVWTLVDCPKGVRPIGTKWVLKNKKDKRGIVVRNKARLVAQGHTQEEGIDYDEVFVHVARIEAIRLFLAYASFMGFTVYQMDVKSAFLYGTIDEEVYEDGIFLSQDKYIGDILKKFGYSDVRSSNTPMDKENPWGKDGTGKDSHCNLSPNITPLKNLIMVRLQFCDYHNMVAILEKGEFNTDFHPMVDFIAASPLKYALTVTPTIFVSHIRQFWSTARIKTTDEGTHILATVDGIQRTVSESSLSRNLKLRDEDGIVSIPDMELFENLTLMGYNISQNQKFTFQKGQFSHQ